MNTGVAKNSEERIPSSVQSYQIPLCGSLWPLTLDGKQGLQLFEQITNQTVKWHLRIHR